MDILRKERDDVMLPTPERRGDDRVATTLSEDTEFSGNLKFDRTLKIEGRFKGDLTSTGTLIVGKTGSVEAEIKVGSIIVEGKIAGNITAEELVDLRSSAEVRGDVTAGRIKIEEGVLFVGKADVQAKAARGSQLRGESRPQSPQPAPAVVPPASQKEAKSS